MRQLRASALAAFIGAAAIMLLLGILVGTTGCAWHPAASSNGVTPPHPPRPSTALHVAWTVMIYLSAAAFVLAIVTGLTSGNWMKAIGGASIALFLACLGQFLIEYERVLTISAGLLALGLFVLALYEAWKNRKALLDTLSQAQNHPQLMTELTGVLPDSVLRRFLPVQSSSPSASTSAGS